MKKNRLKAVGVAAGTVLVGTLAAGSFASADQSPFGMSTLSNGYMVADGMEGSCGGKGKHGSCGAKGKHGSCGAKGKHGSCGAKGKHGSCGGKKSMEGKCGEGKCGGNRIDEIYDEDMTGG